IFVFTLASLPIIVAQYLGVNDFLIPYFWQLFVLFAILTLLIYTVSYWRMGISHKASGQILLGGITIKLLIYMLVAFIYLYNIDVNSSRFLLNFFYLYFFHSVFEIYCLLCNLRNQK